MTYSNLKSSSLIGSLSLILALSGMVACSEKNNPAVKDANNSTFKVSEVKQNGSVLDVGEPNPQGLYYKKSYPISACFKDVAGTNSTANLKYKVVAGEAEVEKISDENGCIQWREVVEYAPQSTESYISMSRTFQAVEKHSGKVNYTIIVNPWKGSFDSNKETSADQASSESSVSYKLKDLTTASVENYKYDIYVTVSGQSGSGILSNSPLQNQTEVSKLYLKAQGIDYSSIEIDQLLNLTFPYDFDLSLSINLLKQTTNGLDWAKIKRGNFKFNLVFTENIPTGKMPEASNVLAVGEFQGSPTGEASLVQLPIILKFKKVASLSRRISVFLTITSLDSPVLFPPQSYSGRFNGVDTQSNLEIDLKKNANTKTAIQLVNEYNQVYDKSNEPIIVEAVLKDEGFSKISNSVYSDKIVRKGWFGDIIEAKDIYVDLQNNFSTFVNKVSNSQADKAALCGFVFEGKTISGKDKNMQLCTASPEKYLNAELSDFVESISEGPSEFAVRSTENLDLTATFELSENKGSESGYSLGGSVGAGANFGLDINASSTGKNEAKYVPGEKLVKPQTGKSDPTKPTIDKETVNSFGSKLGAGLNLNMGLDGKAFASTGLKVSESENNQASLSSSQSLSSLPFSLKFKVNSKKCLLITVKDEYKKIVSDAGFATSKYFCGKSEEKSVVENYYLLKHTQVKEANPVVDLFSSVTNPLSILVRGERPYGFLKTLLTSEDYKFRIFVDPVKGMRSKKILDKKENFITQEAPLMLSSTRKILL